MSITNRKTSGFTLIELLIALATGTLAITALGMFAIYTARGFAAIANYMDLDRNSRTTLDRLSQIIREADGVLSYSPAALQLSYHGTNVWFTYSSDAKALTYQGIDGINEKLLSDCTFFNFEIFQRNSVAGTYDQYPVTPDKNVAKIVQVSWVCSKTLINTLLNSESVQSAKIVIRKQ